ncbi:MAG TPA: non-homologous end-joining DNA ligase [Polyangia bacterium]|nr:non-homologous end-joining DNA ligase [Polyangia bacterium]
MDHLTTRARGPHRDRRRARPSDNSPADRPGERPDERPGERPGERPLVGGVGISHPARVIFQDLGVTKLDIARYYDTVAEWMVPHLAGRPLTLLRCGEAIDPTADKGGCVMLRHAKAWGPPALRRVEIDELHQTGEYLVADSPTALVSLAQMGVLEIHTWNASAERPYDHDRVVFDLDPGPAVAWREVVTAAKRVRAALKHLGLASWVKTTGGKGLHVVAPLAPTADVEASLKFAASVAIGLVAEHPTTYTLAIPRAGREKKILLDFGRNARANTAVAAYSLRARAGAPVSTPLAWDELAPRTAPGKFTIQSVRARLRRVGDVWAGYWKTQESLPPPA